MGSRRMKRPCPQSLQVLAWLALGWSAVSSPCSNTAAFSPLPTTTSSRTARTTPQVAPPQQHRQQQLQQHYQPLYYSDRDANYEGSGNNNRFDDIESNILRNRLQSLQVKTLDTLACRPPHPSLSPTDFVEVFLQCLWENSDPLPDSGFRLLLAASTKRWREQLYQSVGAPWTADADVVASALGEALARPHNQFAILVGEDDSDNDSVNNKRNYVPIFPSDPLEYADDGTAWVECQLRSVDDDTLLATTGWQLEKVNDAWLVDDIVWQDFRDEFRPGIGREEWMRICG